VVGVGFLTSRGAGGGRGCRCAAPQRLTPSMSRLWGREGSDEASRPFLLGAKCRTVVREGIVNLLSGLSRGHLVCHTRRMNPPSVVYPNSAGNSMAFQTG
jgi:hypothetical protein